jgi:hypothetical protein
MAKALDGDRSANGLIFSMQTYQVYTLANVEGRSHEGAPVTKGRSEGRSTQIYDRVEDCLLSAMSERRICSSFTEKTDRIPAHLCVSTYVVPYKLTVGDQYVYRGGLWDPTYTGCIRATRHANMTPTRTDLKQCKAHGNHAFMPTRQTGCWRISHVGTPHTTSPYLSPRARGSPSPPRKDG